MKNTLIIISTALFLAACGKPAEPYQQPQQDISGQPQTGQQYPQQAQQQDSGFGWGSAAIGAAAGYMLGSMGNNNSQSRVVEREVIRDRNVYNSRPSVAPPRPAPVQTPKFTAPVTPKPYVAPTPAPKPSYSGPSSYKSPTYSYKPSAPSRSFSSGRR